MTEVVESKLKRLVFRVKKVRRWLVTIAVLKLAALCLIFVSLYIGVYAWLDHRLNFSSSGRIIALALLTAGVLFLLYRLAKVLLGHISCSGAANYIESKRSFDQQLVTSIEYYEQKQDYPYSRVLAEQLVLRTDEDCRAFEFDSTIAKWLAYVLGTVIVFGLSTTAFYVHDNYVYFSSYFTRLVKPLAAVDPLPPTSLESITEDIIAEPESAVTLAAAIKGEVPEFGHLVLTSSGPVTADSNVTAGPAEMLQLQPSFDQQEKPRLETTKYFEKPDRFKYRFEAGAAFSPWHDLTICSTPKIKSIVANVTLGNNRYVPPYKQEVRNYTLEVPRNSFVTLTVEATEELDRAVVTHLDGKVETQELASLNRFESKFIPRREGFVGFELSSALGVTNKEIPPLQVTMKPDKPPKFKLLSPDGDYLATNVASVPVSFEVTDDFGLDSAEFYMETEGAEPRILKIPVEAGAKSTRFTHTLELEQRDITVGDSILFYAKAADVETGLTLNREAAHSDIYFIEIRPYRQRWHQLKSMLPAGAGKQGLQGEPLEFLITILEYTRAIVKKTWAIAGRSELTALNRSRLDSINKDVQYCAEQLGRIRDFRYGSDENSKATLNEVIRYYTEASNYLVQHDASSALVPEKDAYRVLRKFIIELEKALCPTGGGATPRTRDKVEMEEQVHLTRYEKERIEWELERLAQKLEEIAADQERLKQAFENFLQQQTQEQSRGQETTDEESWIAKSEMPSESRPCPQCGSTEPGGCPACSQRPTVEGALKPPSKTQANAGQQGAQAQGYGQTGTKGSLARAQEMMKMLQAKQGALRDLVEEVSQALQDLPKTSEGGESPDATDRLKAQEHLDKAMAEMGRFQEKLTDARYGTGTDHKEFDEASQALGSANTQLDLAKETIERGLTLTSEQLLAREAQNIAEELSKLAEALDGSVKGVEREQMLARLEEAKRMLELIMNKQWQTQEGQATDLQNIAQGKANINTGSADGSGNYGVTYGGMGGSGGLRHAPPEVARALAREFWSIAIRANKRSTQVIEDEPSDAVFYQLESAFFEEAARFHGTRSVNRSRD